MGNYWHGDYWGKLYWNGDYYPLTRRQVEPTFPVETFLPITREFRSDLIIDLILENKFSFINGYEHKPSIQLISTHSFIPRTDNIDLLLLDEDLWLTEN